MQDYTSLESTLGITFTNKQLLETALTHRSYINEHPEIKEHNERLEFLGDAVLELIVTENLYLNYPNPEGELTNWRAALVNSSMLVRWLRRTVLKNTCCYQKENQKMHTLKHGNTFSPTQSRQSSERSILIKGTKQQRHLLLQRCSLNWNTFLRTNSI